MELVHIYKDGYPNGIEVMPHTYTALRVCHFSGFPTEITSMTTHSQCLETFISVPSDPISTDRIHEQLHTSTQ
uniref:Uncharacterized protein n=1 Tax=Anguilla anguilla TaxID=7936 RepID=A0A0E9VNW0_ANGAN